MLAVGCGLWGAGIAVREEYWLRALGCELADIDCGLWVVGSRLWGETEGAAETDRIQAVGCGLWALSYEMLAVGYGL